MSTIPAVRPGDSANLLFGFKALWDRSDQSSKPFFTPRQNSTVTFNSVNPQSAGAWSFPVVSIHDDAKSLINKLYDYRVLPADFEEKTFSIPVGSLTLGDSDSTESLKSIGDYIGIDLTKGDSYMLVRMVRNDGNISHQIVSDFGKNHRDDYLSKEVKDALKAFSTILPENYDQSTLCSLTPDQGKTLLSLYYDFGTHFVSKVKLGDVIFQVFAINSNMYEDIKSVFAGESADQDEISGIDSLSYIYYTTPYNENSRHMYGYVSQYGSIISFAQDPVLSTTLANGDWKDSKHCSINSIFMAFDSSKNKTNFCSKFTAITSTGFELLPITQLFTDTKLARIWNRLFKGVMLQKYALDMQFSFPANTGYTWSNLFSNSSDSWLSTIATPFIDIYQEYVNISNITLVNKELVNNFSTFSQVLEIHNEQPVRLPGKNINFMSYTVDAAGAKRIPVIELSKDAYKSHSFECGKMLGALIVRTVDGTNHYSIVDGLVLKTSANDTATGRSTVLVAASKNVPPPLSLLKNATTNLGYSMIAAQSAIASRGSNAVTLRQFEKEYLDWVVKIIPITCDDTDLLNMRTQAIYLSKISRNLQTEGVVVPYLTYESYKGYVDSLITVADDMSDKLRDYQSSIARQKQAELTIKTAQQLNDNIKSTGKLLTDYFYDMSKYQTDMSGYYDMIVTQKQKEFYKTITDINNLNNLMIDQQKAVDDAVYAFKKAIVEWETEEIFKFCLQIATDVFSLGVAFALPSTEIKSVLALGETAQKIQKVLNVLNSLLKLEQGIEQEVKSLQGVTRALSMLDSEMSMPSSREWQEFSINLEASLCGVPNDKGPQAAKANLVAAFKILVLRAQAWLDANAKLRQISTDMYYNQRLQKINSKQAERMSDLSKSLNLGNVSDPEISSIDLVGISGQVQFQMKQIMAMFADVLILQDAAVQYEYLGEPTSITRFDLTSVKQVMALQQQNIVNALTLLNPTPKPVDSPVVYRISKVPVSELTKGNVYEFIVQPSVSEFIKYSMVRIDKVVANVIGIDNTDSGEYLINLTYKGNPFEDRDMGGNSITFNTNERYFGPYDYRISDGKAIFGDQTGAIDSKITKVTPFSNWQISLPDNSTNKNISFNDITVDIELTFNITALLVDMKGKPIHRKLLKTCAMPEANDGTTSASSATVDFLLEQMYQNNAVLKGWDVVFNLLEEPVNNFLKAQYDKKYSDSPMTITVGFCELVDNPDPDPQPPATANIASYTKFNVFLEQPLMQFETNNSDYVTVTQNITAGFIQKGSRYVDDNFDPKKDCNLNDPQIKWRPQQTIDPGQNPYIQGTVALGMVDGLVNDKNGNKNTRSVILDFKKASFTANNMNIAISNTNLRAELTTYFTDSDIQYIVNTLDLTNITTLDSLCPQSFKLNVLTTNSRKNILQIFITTNGTAQSNLTINVNEPIPDNYDCALMINTKIMFKDIFVQSFNSGATDITVQAIDPGVDYKAWSAKIATGTVTGPVDFGDDREQYRISDNSNTIKWDISGMTFSPDKTNGIALNYSQRKNVVFQYRDVSYDATVGQEYGSWEDHSVDVDFIMTGTYPITVGESEGLQTIQIASIPPTVNIDNSSLKPTGPCECNDNTLQIRVKDEMKKDIPRAIQQQIAKVTFKPISIFALENLLFPAMNFIQMDCAYLPCDLVVLGHFEQSTGNL